MAVFDSCPGFLRIYVPDVIDLKVILFLIQLYLLPLLGTLDAQGKA